MFVYKITNKINGKIYIGMDSKDVKLESRWKHHMKIYNNKGKEYNMQYGGGAPLLKTLPLSEQIRLRKARSKG